MEATTISRASMQLGFIKSGGFLNTSGRRFKQKIAVVQGTKRSGHMWPSCVDCSAFVGLAICPAAFTGSSVADICFDVAFAALPSL